MLGATTVSFHFVTQTFGRLLEIPEYDVLKLTTETL